MTRRRHFLRWRFVPVSLAMCLASVAVHAQQATTPEQRRQAGAAYDQAVGARAEGDHAHAASMFETADRLAPSAQALGNAIRSHRDAHGPTHDARAATLAVRMLSRYGDNPRLADYAHGVIRDLAPTLSRVRVDCQGCDVEVDHTSVSDHEFYLEPGDHTVVGYWGQRTQSHALSAHAGGDEQIALTAPPEQANTAPVQTASATTSSSPTGTSTHETESATSPGGAEGDRVTHSVPFLVPVIALVLTVGAGAVLAWSGVDTNAGVPAYDANPTLPGLQAGQAEELRTNVMIGVTAGLGAITLVTAIAFAATGHHVHAGPAVATTEGAIPGVSIGGSF